MQAKLLKYREARLFIVASALLTIVLLFWSVTTANAQSTPSDSIVVPENKDAVFERQLRQEDSNENSSQHGADSLENQYQSKLDKIDSVGNRRRQSNFKGIAGKIDSIQTSFHQRSDSLKNTLQGKLRFWEKTEAKLKAKMDSLSSRNLPGGEIKEKLDSIDKLRDQTLASFDKKLQSLKDHTSKKINELDLSSEAKEKVAAVTKNIDGVNLRSLDGSIPGVKTVSNPLGNAELVGDVKNIPGLDSPTLPSADAAKLGSLNTPSIDQPKQMQDINGKTADLSKISKQASSYSKDAAELAKANVNEVRQLPKTGEEKAASISGIKTAEQQTKQLDEYKSMTSKVKDQEALKKEATEKAKKVAINHFAGKETELKSAMEKVSKYKQKYSSLNGVKDLSKKRPNEMRDKPLVERIVPGIAFQLQNKGDNLMVDLNPYAGYRFTERIRAGFGWNQRVGYNTSSYRFNSSVRVFGPRVFGELKLAKGFSPRAELEVMNTVIPPLLLKPNDPSQRQWVWGAFVGMKKEYKIWKSLKGTAMVMGRVFNPQHKSPYADVLNVRFGFELPMKKKAKAGK